MSDAPVPVTLIPFGLLIWGIVVVFIPVVRGVDVMTCCWPVVIGFMYARVVLRGASVCGACGFAYVVGATVVLRFCG